MAGAPQECTDSVRQVISGMFALNGASVLGEEECLAVEGLLSNCE